MKDSVLKNLNKKVDEMDTALHGKIKLTESKLDRKLQELIESNIVMR